ncbi:winged helix-turn-helix domain-containing protein [Poseidonibacter lekithochrous]|uniref:winged helix-turn-helix domain-containing protein n=1 Tax=Poseidonibacter TaxID=2321187 RepID=UPI001C092AF7|nr:MULTISPECIES: winged helix-turn-helix domain-containing protein [Poseidonibacter]MBU3013133.1 winged helix-turn-helix domain-containing protein [Poseidonibacter lekithochrous]MDO6826429.1 winged helix-turn-helix domain-containing protein [Poseidonibacter sp. 1_MG-2023]
MSKTNNEIMFLKYKSILVLDGTNKKLLKLNKLLEDKVKEIKFNNDIIKIEELVLYDLIIVDLDYLNFDDINIIYNNSGINIPIICITSSLNENVFKVTKNSSVKNVLIDEVQLEQIDLYITLALNERKKIELKNHHTYNLESAKLFYKLQEIKLTKYESDLLKILILNKNTILTYEEIESKVWGAKKCSIYSMRNIVNKIRDKSFQSIIKNVSKTGYVFDNSEFY